MSFNLTKLLPTLFPTEQDVDFSLVDELKMKIDNLSPTVANASDFMKERAGLLLHRYNETSALACFEALDGFSTVNDLQDDELVTYNDKALAAGHLLTSIRKAMTGSTDIPLASIQRSYIIAWDPNGKPVYLTYMVEVAPSWIEYAAVGRSVDNSGIVNYEDYPAVVRPAIMQDDERANFVNFIDLDSDLFSFESTIYNLQAKVNSLTCFGEILSKSALNNLSWENIKQITSNYGVSESITMFLNSLRGQEFSFKTLLYTILAILNGSLGTDVSDSGFIPYEKPTYCTDVFAMVWSIVSSVISIVLSALFNTIGFILSAVWTLINTLVKLIRDYVVQTNATVLRYSDYPVYNYPLSRPFEIKDSLPREVIDQLSETGRCVIGMVDALNPTRVACYLVVYPSSDEKYFGQLLLPVYGETNYQFSGRQLHVDFTADLPGGKYVCTVQDGYYDPSLPNNSSYLVCTDEQLRIGAYSSIASALNIIANTRERPTWSTQVEVTQIAANYIYAAADIISGAHNVGDVSAYSRLRVASGLLINYQTAQTGNSWTEIEHLMSVLYDFNGWETVFTNFFTSQARVNEDAVFCLPVPDIDTPSVDFPNLSISALVQALVVTALATVATVATALVVRRSLKAKAVASLAAREEQFNKAKANYIANPDDTSARYALYKANKKLTRAWKRSGKIGVAMYNGFSTGDSAAIAGGNPSLFESGTSALLEATNGAPTNQDIYYSITGTVIN